MRRALIVLSLALLVVACGVNPVTGKRELSLVSEGWELDTGKKYYLPSRQAQGGDYAVDPELSRYVQGVGARVAAHADRKLPYEFAVLNNSVPNAWALPGGKIAVNRGLLLELADEAELAAVLGHEITHAAARHGAQAHQRGLLAQAGVAVIALGAGKERNGALIVGGATLGLALATQKYGRDAELQSDRYGTEYMAKAGYDPRAAISLQETFVRLADGKRQDWLSGLFASHPPSRDRVAANARHAERLGATGERGRERYQAAIATLMRTKEAYAAYDKGAAALEKAPAEALKLAEQALAGEPREALFYALKGDALAAQQKRAEAVRWYDQAIERNPDYYEFWLARGLARQAEGDQAGARADLEHANRLLPTATANEALGGLALAAGDQAGAERHLRAASASPAPEGQRASRALARLVLARAPGEYLDTRAELDAEGRVLVVVLNRAPIAVADVVLAVTRHETKTRGVLASETVKIPRRLDAGASIRVPTRLAPLADPKQLKSVQVEVRAAKAAD